MSEKLSIYPLFEQIVVRLLAANGFLVDQKEPIDSRFDFTATRGNDVWAVEIKFYRTIRAQVSLLESAAARLVTNLLHSNLENGLLIVTCDLSPSLRVALESKFGLKFVDRANLLTWAAKTPDILDELSALLEERRLPEQVGKEPNFVKSLESASRHIAAPVEDTKGTKLCQKIRTLKRGKKSWSAYEKLCDQILKYLFPNDLHGWHTQKRTDDGLNRFDYICRIKPTTEFWSFLIDHLNSRYVLFEFKNYTEKIKQGQILTTEKYLLEKGLRRAAIVFSRTGADKTAISMTQGAMRESGKLLLILDDNQICKMLKMKEEGEDPTDFLFEIADEFLLKLPR